MECPKCGFEQADQNRECLRCGIIVEKYLKLQAEKSISKPVDAEAEEGYESYSIGEWAVNTLF